MTLQPAAPGDFSRNLLRWYCRRKRELPWRASPSAYGTVVSELMLQQTQVATVVPYFGRFMQRFPSLRHLARATEDQVMAAWSGLGYYRRARHLHRLAQVVVCKHGGALPTDEAALQELPGIGPYTAAAVAAIAFGRVAFALDGNAARVMARLHGERRPIDDNVVKKSLHARGLALVPARRPGDFAQAVMELGARVCVESQPRCDGCPVASGCVARARGVTNLIPVRLPQRPKKTLRLACVAAQAAGRVYLVRQGTGALFAGTWTLPARQRRRETAADTVVRILGASGIRTTADARALGVVCHTLTHREIEAQVIGVAAKGRLHNSATGRWVSEADLRNLGTSTFARKTLALCYRMARKRSPSTM